MSDLIKRLRALDTCAVSDALDKAGIRGVVAGPRPLAAQRPAAGAAMTVQLGDAPPQPGDLPRRHLGTAAVDAAGPGQVIVVAHGGRSDCAGWGGLLSRGAASRGVEGVVVDGAARDLAEAAAIGLPVYALEATPVSARGRAAEVSWDQPVTLAGVLVRPGDFVLADSGGVVIVPAEQAEEVITVAEGLAAAEAAMARAIESGTPVSTVMGASYEEMSR